MTVHRLLRLLPREPTIAFDVRLLLIADAGMTVGAALSTMIQEMLQTREVVSGG
jgi:hypothetical protein